MTDINKQKFLTELSKLLTFMYEEDRLDALYLYEEMFDNCRDEQQLIHHLVSPTRQAVVLARAYNSKERMLSVQSQTKRDGLYDDEGVVPAFISAIENIKYEAADLFEDKPKADDAQFSLFSDDEQEKEEPASTADIPSVKELIGDDAGKTEDDTHEEAEPVIQKSEVSEEADNYDEPPAIEIVDADDEELRFSTPVHRDAVVTEEHSRYKRPTRRKRIVILLILYIIFALPITILGVALLMVPTVLCLSLAVLFVAFGLGAVGCAFGSFAIFADILVVLGSGLILLALGLFFLWAFVWFIGGAIAGFVNGVIKLGDRFSSREVSAE